MNLDDRLKALTVWQPWASLITEGHKIYEYRPYRPPVNGPPFIDTDGRAHPDYCRQIAIHAGKRPVRAQEVAAIREAAFWDDAIMPTAIPYLDMMATTDYPLGQIIGTVLITGAHQVAEGPAEFPNNKWAWHLDHPRPCNPIPIRGWQRLWTMPWEIEITYP